MRNIPQDIAVKRTAETFESLLKVDANATARFIDGLWLVAQTTGIGGIIGSLYAMRERAQHEIDITKAAG